MQSLYALAWPNRGESNDTAVHSAVAAVRVKLLLSDLVFSPSGVSLVRSSKALPAPSTAPETTPPPPLDPLPGTTPPVPPDEPVPPVPPVPPAEPVPLPPSSFGLVLKLFSFLAAFLRCAGVRV